MWPLCDVRCGSAILCRPQPAYANNHPKDGGSYRWARKLPAVAMRFGNCGSAHSALARLNHRQNRRFDGGRQFRPAIDYDLQVGFQLMFGSSAGFSTLALESARFVRGFCWLDGSPRGYSKPLSERLFLCAAWEHATSQKALAAAR